MLKVMEIKDENWIVIRLILKQMGHRLVPNQSENIKYNLISVEKKNQRRICVWAASLPYSAVVIAQQHNRITEQAFEGARLRLKPDENFYSKDTIRGTAVRETDVSRHHEGPINAETSRISRHDGTEQFKGDL